MHGGKTMQIRVVLHGLCLVRVCAGYLRRQGSSVVAARDARSFSLIVGVIECGLLSGLIVRHYQKPRAGMVISGLGPNLFGELAVLSPNLVFPIQIFPSVTLCLRVRVTDMPFWRIKRPTRR